MLFPLDKIPDELSHLWAGDVDAERRRFVVLGFLSESQGYPNDESGDSFEQDDRNSYLGKDCGLFNAAHFGFCENTKIILGGRVGSLGSGPECF